MGNGTKASERNRRRAVRILAALAYAGYDDLPESDIIDVLTDVMHFCAIEGIDFEDSLRMARRHYEEERDGRDDW